MSSTQKIFDVTTHPLSGRNLIEASAGTGKTYSIALLVIRLIVEKQIDIKNILMVTFTNAAVAELEGRIRSFISQANSYAQKGETEGISPEIVKIVDEARDEPGENRVRMNLKLSLQHLDETSIFTIHSFCQRTLTEFAFETGQSFESELVSDTESMIEEAVNNFWRERVTIVDLDILKLLKNLSISHLKRCVSNQLDEEMDNSASEEEMAIIGTELLDEIVLKEEAWQTMGGYYELHRKAIIEESQTGGQKRTFSEIANTKDVFLETYAAKVEEDSVKYMLKFLPDLKPLAEDYNNAIQSMEDLSNNYYFLLVKEAVVYTRKEIDRKKKRLGILFYNDLIENLHDGVNGPNKNVLVNALNKKYQAVFIDEFHDTDSLQYDIFYSLFGEGSIMFLIGDPKQSIYGWRGADLNTYKKAAEQAAQYTMDRNFRSTGKYIEAMNALYSSAEDPFLDSQISYKKVKQGQDVGVLLKGNQEVIPLSIMNSSTIPIACVQVADEINKLLTEDYFIEIDGKKSKVIPSDIAVLVRKNKESKQIKQVLVKKGIPAITYDDAKVMKSDEAKSIMYVLSAMIRPNKSNINRALATSFTGKTNEEIVGLNDEEELSRFRVLRDTLEKIGVYTAFMEFARFYEVQARSLQNVNGERIISNFLQIAELLQRRETEKGQTPEQLLNWIQRVSEGEGTSGDEYLQRVESDENAVTISTIHKSKGLAYKIVFAPFLDMKYTPDKKPCKKKVESAEIIKTDQENRRLMYVALTRAVYKSYINLIGSKKGTITDFKTELDKIDVRLAEKIIVDKNKEEEKLEKKYVPEGIESKHGPREFKASINRKWRILSFTGLSKPHGSLSIEKKEYDKSEYEEFVYGRMPGGVLAGLFLHEIFENIDFTDPTGWADEIKRVGNKYNISVQDDMTMYMLLINNILKANYSDGSTGFELAELKPEQRINELEFYFSLNDFKAGELTTLLKQINVDNYSYEGAMHGYVDLFFEMNGKYYVLDWKSNFLGNTVEQYSADRLEQAMTANNYHLQYIVYTIAVKRFLENRIADFDYDKHFGGIYYVFLRGCREGEKSGLFYTKPEFGIIEKIDSIFSTIRA